MVKVEVKYFATLAEVAGRLSEEMALEEATVGALTAELARRYGAPFDFLARPSEMRSLNYIIAVNGNDVRPDDALATPLADGDSVALIPPVAGGGPCLMPLP